MFYRSDICRHHHHLTCETGHDRRQRGGPVHLAATAFRQPQTDAWNSRLFAAAEELPKKQLLLPGGNTWVVVSDVQFQPLRQRAGATANSRFGEALVHAERSGFLYGTVLVGAFGLPGRYALPVRGDVFDSGSVEKTVERR